MKKNFLFALVISGIMFLLFPFLANAANHDDPVNDFFNKYPNGLANLQDSTGGLLEDLLSVNQPEDSLCGLVGLDLPSNFMDQLKTTCSNLSNDDQKKVGKQISLDMEKWNSVVDTNPSEGSNQIISDVKKEIEIQKSNGKDKVPIVSTGSST